MRIAIAGAGNVGRAIARELLDNGHQVLLIEKDPKALKIESVPDAEHLVIYMTRMRPTGTSRSPTDPPLLGPCPFFRGMGGTGCCETTRALCWAYCFEHIYIIIYSTSFVCVCV